MPKVLHALRRALRPATALALTAMLAACGQVHQPTPTARHAQSLKGLSATGFLWGASTAGVQYEGGDDKSNWAKWVEGGHTPDTNDRGAEGYARYESDLDLAKGMGLNTFRMSLEWSRLEPKPGQIDPAEVAHYHRVLRAIHARGMEPVITLMHFSYPAWLDAQGGWESAKAVEAYEKYVAFVAKEFGDEITYYLTFNEPNMYLLNAYGTGAFPPGKKFAPIAALKVTRHFIAAHKAAYRAIHAADAQAKVSFNMYAAEYRIGTQPNLEDEATGGDKAAMFVAEAMGRSDGERTLDYIAFDYYCRVWIGFPVRVVPHDQWEVYPEGFYKAIKRYYKWTHLPVLIAENGMATADLAPRKDGWTRGAYLVAHVAQMQRAIAEGVPVLGYIHWSITDNWEWGSFTPRFGLYSVEAKHGDFRRVPTDGVEAYRAVTAAGGVTPEILARFPGPAPVRLGLAGVN